MFFFSRYSVFIISRFLTVYTDGLLSKITILLTVKHEIKYVHEKG